MSRNFAHEGLNTAHAAEPYDLDTLVHDSSLARPQLRDPYPTDSIDALSIAPQPGELGPLYVEAREKYNDGMSLALATPKRSYSEIAAEYAARREETGFSPVEFWDENFDTPEPEARLSPATPGMTLDEYTLAIRPEFIHPSVENGNFDIWLPYDRSVAGAGRFSQHSFLWDGYHMAAGYREDGRWDLVLNTVDNYEHQVNRFGHGLNGSAANLATRAQLPYFSNEVSMLADEYGDEALVRYLPAMEKEYQDYWMDGKQQLDSLPDDGRAHSHRTLVRLPLGNGKFAYLNRFWDDDDGPRLESYKEDFELGELVTRGLQGELRDRRLKKLYKDVRGGAASGWDFSSRWLKDGKSMETINTTDIIPIDLQCMLARTEQMLARAHRAAENIEESWQYELLFSQRIEAINKINWDPKDKIYRDYNYVQKQQTSIESAAMAYPLYVGISNVEQTHGVARAINDKLLFRGGVVATTTEDSDQQWDGKNVWAPPNWAAARGLARMAHIFAESGAGVDVRPLIELAERVRENYTSGVQAAFKATRGIPEKHNGEEPHRIGTGGEYAPVEDLAMTGEIWRALQNWDPRDPEGCLPVGVLAVHG
jgi:alpha,alpha-trehalase